MRLNGHHNPASKAKKRFSWNGSTKDDVESRDASAEEEEEEEANGHEMSCSDMEEEEEDATNNTITEKSSSSGGAKHDSLPMAMADAALDDERLINGGNGVRTGNASAGTDPTDTASEVSEDEKAAKLSEAAVN